MLKEQIVQEFRALVLGMGKFPRFAPMLALAGAMALGLGLSDAAAGQAQTPILHSVNPQGFIDCAPQSRRAERGGKRGREL